MNVDLSDYAVIDFHDVQVGDITKFRGVWVTITKVEVVELPVVDDPFITNQSTKLRKACFKSLNTSGEDYWQCPLGTTNSKKFYRWIVYEPEEELEL